MEESEEQVLVASVHDVRQFAAILRGVSICGRATLSIMEAGLQVTVSEARTLVAQAYIPLSLFDEYKYTPEREDLARSQASDQEDTPSTTVGIPLDTLIECLNIFGSATSSGPNTSFEFRQKRWRHGSDDDNEEAVGRGRGRRGKAPKGNATIDQFFQNSGERRTGMRMSYAGAGYPLKLILAEDATGPTTTCEIQTLENEAILNLPFDASRKVIKIILQSSWLRDALSELDPSCDKLTFIGIPSSWPPDHPERAHKGALKPIFRLSAEGTFGSAQMDYPNERDVLESFECAVFVKSTYHVVHIKSALRALQSSSRTSLRIDDEGLLSLQFMMAKNAFIEFKCLPIEDDL